MFEWILHIIESGGYAGIFLLMILENLFPPIPSELVIPLAGFAAAKGELNIIGVFIATCLGSLVGCIPWYILGRLYGTARLKRLSFKYGRALTLSADDVDGAQVWFKKHGHLAVFFGRLVPAVRTLISVPAGIARMPFGIFMLYSFLGIIIWTCTLLFFGYVLESQYATLSIYIDFVSNAIIFSFIAIYLYRVVTYTNIDTKKAP
jgi:membrane protein DedA with SNARE-associated domain